MKSITVFCGSNEGNHPAFTEAARRTGELLAEHQIRLIFGGGTRGLMGIVAQASLAKGGKVLGILPELFDGRSVHTHPNYEHLLVSDLASRKKIMFELSDGIITLPGGYGTADELFEALTLFRLDQFDKPISIYNVNDFFKGLIDWIETAKSSKFIEKELKKDFYALNSEEDLKAFLKGI